MGFLRTWFPPKTEAWRPLAEDLGGRFLEGNWRTPDRIEVPRAGRTQTVTARRDTDTGQWTTAVQMPIDILPGESVGVLKDWPGQKVLDLACSLAGLRTMPLRDLGVQGEGRALAREDAAARALFADPRLRNAVSAQERLLLFVGQTPRLSSMPAGEGPAVLVMAPELLTDLSSLAALLELHGVALDALEDRAAGDQAV